MLFNESPPYDWCAANGEVSAQYFIHLGRRTP